MVNGSGSYYNYIGGIVGASHAGDSINKCNNSGNITLLDVNNGCRCGGIIGYGGSSETIKNSSNSGDITVSNGQNSNYIGGLAGYGTGQIETCDNSGDIQAINLQSSYIGGIVSTRNRKHTNM